LHLAFLAFSRRLRFGALGTLALGLGTCLGFRDA
jgi:hypothetical protein